MSDEIVMAVDCDLHSIYCWCSKCGAVCSDFLDVEPVWQHYDKHANMNSDDEIPHVLFEIGSPVSAKRGGESSAIMYNLSKWLIFNSCMAFNLNMIIRGHLLVAPSNKWTKGYELKTRHTLAKADAKNKDLRECQSMIFFYQHDPKPWVPLSTYLRNL